MEAKSYWAFKTGLFLVVLSWFSFTIYQLGKGMFNGVDIPFTDVPATIGLSFRAATGFIALITSARFFLLLFNNASFFYITSIGVLRAISQ